MMKPLVLLGLALFHLVAVVSGAVLADLVTFQPGTTFGGCDLRRADLDTWYSEILESLQTTLGGITEYNSRTADGERVRKLMFDFFRIPMTIPVSNSLKPLVQQVADKLNAVADWLQDELNNIPQARTFFFCDSTFLVLKDAQLNQAQDFQGNGIVNATTGQPVNIFQINAYARALAGGNVPWWSGDHTPVNGYYITSPQSGGNYCNGEDFGLTATLKALDANGNEIRNQQVQMVIICPYSFTQNAPVSYRQAVGTITANTPLNMYVPKSSSLLHEAFHVVFGDQMFDGDGETYGLAECIEVGKINIQSSRKNPENYVYFIAAMHYIFGDAMEGITTNWDFATNTPQRAVQIP
ncbi:hypothetical protein F5Y12DRAFT_797650 [Xylaria sp. FL1777]|nr:hypothetical protein F5Y12DRAFT_797650 [Xylaria sp. FL1777]